MRIRRREEDWQSGFNMICPTFASLDPRPPNINVAQVFRDVLCLLLTKPFSCDTACYRPMVGCGNLSCQIEAPALVSRSRRPRQ